MRTSGRGADGQAGGGELGSPLRTPSLAVGKAAGGRTDARAGGLLGVGRAVAMDPETDRGCRLASKSNSTQCISGYHGMGLTIKNKFGVQEGSQDRTARERLVPNLGPEIPE